MRDKCKLTQQRQDVLRGLVCLRQNRSTRLLQNVCTRHVGHFGRVVSIFDTATGRSQVVNGVPKVGDSGIETVLYRTEITT